MVILSPGVDLVREGANPSSVSLKLARSYRLLLFYCHNVGFRAHNIMDFKMRLLNACTIKAGGVVGATSHKVECFLFVKCKNDT